MVLHMYTGAAIKIFLVVPIVMYVTVKVYTTVFWAQKTIDGTARPREEDMGVKTKRIIVWRWHNILCFF